MSEIIKKWITRSIGLVMNMTPDIFGADAMDGTILARLLHNYNVITQEQLITILPTDVPNIALRNLRKIKIWLKLLDIHCTEEALIEISLKKSSEAIKLFYEVYLALHDKDKLYFIAKKRGIERLHPTDIRFDVILAPEEKDTNDSEISDHPLSEPLVVNRNIIEWNQNRYERMLEKYDTMRETYTKHLQEKFGITYPDKFGKYAPSEQRQDERLETQPAESVEYTYEELTQQQQDATHIEIFQQDPIVAKKIVNKLKHKRKKEIEEKELRVHNQKLLLLDLWNKLLTEQEREFEESISKKMLKQSEFEKQMVTKMIEVRQQKINILRNQRYMDEQTMKKREEEFLEHVFLREKGMGDQKYSYYVEKERLLELHRRLYAEKMRLRAERHFNMCQDIVEDMASIAIRHSEFKEQFNEEVPRRVHNEWVNLFIKQRPIFDIMDDVENVVNDRTDFPEDLEEIYCIEIDRQNALDQRDFENYFYFEWPWQLEDLLTDHKDDLVSIEMGMNILGHNVHRVLLTKYPKPLPPSKPNLPPVTIAACINGLPDLTILPILQKILMKKGIKIIEMQEAINYCLEAYTTEIATEYIDDSLIKESTTALNNLSSKQSSKKDKSSSKQSSKKDKGSSKQSSKKGDKPEKGKKNANLGKKKKGGEKATAAPSFEDKECQTPRIYPCEEIVLSPKAELGKTAYETLHIGEMITDNLLVAMFVEYLKTLNDFNGWVLINFPTTIVQAVLLEEGLTGIQIPGYSDNVKAMQSDSIGDIADLEYREPKYDSNEKSSKYRTSRLVPNPPPIFDEFDYDTFLTAYIHAQPADDELKLAKHESQDEIKDELEKFYSEQGCNYAFFYKKFELATVTQLAKLIYGDYSLPRKTSVEIFGDIVLRLGDELEQRGATPGMEAKSKKVGGKKSKPKKEAKAEKVEKKESTPGKEAKKKGSKPGKESKAEKGKKKGASEASQEKKVSPVTIIEAVPEDKPATEEKAEEVVEPIPEPKAGELLWRYVDLAFPNDFQIALASLWQNLEEVYFCDFKELFFLKRIIWNAAIPYLTHMRDHMEVYIARPDDKQTYLHKFQSIYNEIADDMRDDEELKAELHCGIAEFRSKLWNICDTRMQESEQERQRIIGENWVSIQACELTNNYITAMQLEIDRCCDSFQFITDYYCGIITKMPCDEPVLSKSALRKISINGSDHSNVSVIGQVKAEAALILTNPEHNSIETPFHYALEKNVKTGDGHVNKWEASCSAIVLKLEAMLQPGSKKNKPGSKKDAKPKSGSKKGTAATAVKTLPRFLEPAEDVMSYAPRLLEEWNSAIKGEAKRVKLRLKMLKERGLRDLNDIINCSKKVFHGIFNDIRDRYNREIDSVSTACEVLARAVEAETRLQPELVLDGDKFYVEPNVLLFPDPLPPPEPPISEPEINGVFTLAQLEVFANICMDLAPYASIPERALVYLLQDMIVQNAEDGKRPMVPCLWQMLKPEQVSQLSREIFGDVEFIDWKDFIIYNLCISFPTEDELLETRQQFREHDPDITETVLDYQYYNVQFWFEKNEENQHIMLRNQLIKKLLFTLFRVKNDTLNYTTLLLAFCKDVNPVMGFVKALALAFGKPICWNVTAGNIYVASVREQRYIDEQKEILRQLEHEEAVNLAQSVVDTVVDTTVHLCDSVILEDYQFEEKSSAKEESPTTSTYNQSHEERKSVVDVVFEDFKKETIQEIFRQEFILEEKFSNVEIGFQPVYIEPKVYLLPFEAALTVLTCCLPWHTRAQTISDRSLREKLESVYSEVRNPEFNDTALTHELLNNRAFKDLLLSLFKFIEKCPPKIVQNLIDDGSVTNLYCSNN